MTVSDITTLDRSRLLVLLIIALGLCLRMVYFSHEIGGSHTFRQAMVVNQADSLKSGPYPGPKLGFLERYDQTYDFGVIFFDTPIYQYAAAKLSDLLGISSIRAARIINLAAYAGVCLALVEILTMIGISFPVTALALVLLAVSPLSIQNTIGIYPDSLATLAAYLSFLLLLKYERSRSFLLFGSALALGAACALIKSSIYTIFLGAWLWIVLWSGGWRALRRFDAVAFTAVIALSVVAFVIERTWFNYGNLSGAGANYDESMRLSWFLGSETQRLDPAQWRLLGARFAQEYLFPAFVPATLAGLWRVTRQFVRKPADPQLTLFGLVLGSIATILVFFNVVVIHDYYALPLLPIFCVLTSIGLFYLRALLLPPVGHHPRAWAAVATVTIVVSLWYAYSLRLLNYDGNKSSVETGLSLQELVPENGYVFYLLGADYVNPEFLYYARRRGILRHIEKVDNDFVARVMRDHKWDSRNTYVLGNAIRLNSDAQKRLKARLDGYDLQMVGTSIDNGIVYKLAPKR